MQTYLTQINIIFEYYHASGIYNVVVENFLEIAKHIYPTEIPLEQTDNDSLHDTFLDLDITVVNNRFCFKVFHKVDLFDFEVISFPFLESNIPQYICYNTFFSQLVRFSTICSNTSGFAERVHIIYQKLLKRNYDKKKLEKTFNNLLVITLRIS